MEKVIKNINYSYYRRKVCNVCLSRDRQLYTVEKYADIFKNVCGNLEVPFSPMVCWECDAILKKIKQFKNKVAWSIKILRQIADGENPNPDSLSKLEIIQNRSIVIAENKNDEDESIIKIKEEDSVQNSTQPPPNCAFSEFKYEIKQEVLEESECNNGYNAANYYCSIEIDGIPQDEVKDEVKTMFTDKNEANSKRVINKQYRIIGDEEGGRQLKGFTREIPLTIEQVKYYMEKERDSALYNEWSYKCELCICSWKTKQKLMEHNKQFHSKDDAKPQCDICLSRFSCKGHLLKHLHRHFNILECLTCQFRSYTNQMKRHLQTHIKKIECVQCAARFSNIHMFYQHHKELHVKYVCDICGKKARSKRVLEKHMRHHYENFSCKVCDRSYKSRASYRRHVEDKHSTWCIENAYCVQCDKKFSSIITYKRHIATNSTHAAEIRGDKSLEKVPCPDCGRLYSRKCYMENHYRHVHLKQSPYHCHYCDKDFLNRTRYRDHMKYSHEGMEKVKNKLCNICGRGFAANRTLVNHIRTHSGERPFECEYCNARFSQKHAMQSHVNYVHLKKSKRIVGNSARDTAIKKSEIAI
ncbi:unnamed protein product [Chilo suppressalis]|uniref:C2H2-type domain-containing protein n=1 Tax=Chilo suppressalis TaxID=168631 RepID=A0ABN8B4D4_CHISP|nr:unnamed protein product [Chilo suppressalis]